MVEFRPFLTYPIWDTWLNNVVGVGVGGGVVVVVVEEDATQGSSLMGYLMEHT